MTTRDLMVEGQNRMTAKLHKLQSYQRLGVRFLRSHRLALLADEMRLGKSVQVLSALTMPAVVICPAGVKSAWAREVHKWRKDLTPVILNGRGSFRLPKPNEVVICNFESFTLPLHLVDYDWTLVIDEAHRLGNPSTAYWPRLSRLAQHAEICWLLTGTPLLNRPAELWNMLACGGLAIPAYQSWANFVRVFNGELGERGMEWGEPTAEAWTLLERVMLRRLRKDVWKANVRVDSRTLHVEVAIDDDLQALLDKAYAEVLASPTASFKKISYARAALAAAKIPSIPGRNKNKQLLIYSAHRAPVEHLLKRGPKYAAILGSTPRAERNRLVKQFQSGRIRALACTIRAAGEGICLDQADEVIFVDLDWTPARNAQALDRVISINRTKPLLVTVMQANHILDRHVNKVLLRKSKFLKGL